MTRKQITALRCATRTLAKSKEYKENATYVPLGKDPYFDGISYQEALETLIDIIIKEEENEALSHSERP